MTQKMTEEEIKGLIEAFQSFDLDGTGQIEPHELNRILLKCGISRTPKEIAEIIEEVDITHDGEINFLEFCTMVKTRDQVATDMELDEIFEKFQGKQSMVKNGLMSRADLSLVFKSLNEDIDDSEIDQLFDEVGLRNQMSMNKEQFCSLFKKGQAPST